MKVTRNSFLPFAFLSRYIAIRSNLSRPDSAPGTHNQATTVLWYLSTMKNCRKVLVSNWNQIKYFMVLILWGMKKFKRQTPRKPENLSQSVVRSLQGLVNNKTTILQTTSWTRCFQHDAVVHVKSGISKHRFELPGTDPGFLRSGYWYFRENHMQMRQIGAGCDTSLGAP